MSMEENLRKYIDELIQEVEHELDEATTTAGVDGYQTPFAFGGGRGKDKKKQKKNIDVTGYTKVKDIDESINEAELKLGVKYVNKQGKEGFIQTGGSKNSKDWFWFDGKTKHPYDKVKKELKPSKDQKKTGFGDYLKQGGRVWDNVNPTDSPSVNEAKFGYKDSTASYINKHKDEYKQAEKMNNGNEKKFYDMLQQMEEKVGHGKTMLFISNALRGYGVDMFKDPKIKNPQDAQEALFLLSK